MPSHHHPFLMPGTAQGTSENSVGNCPCPLPPLNLATVVTRTDFRIECVSRSSFPTFERFVEGLSDGLDSAWSRYPKKFNF